MYFCGDDILYFDQHSARNEVRTFPGIFVAGGIRGVLDRVGRDSEAVDLFPVDVDDHAVVHRMSQLQLDAGVRDEVEVYLPTEVEGLHVLARVVESGDRGSDRLHRGGGLVCDEHFSGRPGRIVKTHVPPDGA